MKPTHFVRSYLNRFHNKPDDAGGGGGGGVVMPSLMDQIAGIVAPGMRLATTDLGAGGGGDGETGSGGDGETGGAGEGGAGAAGEGDAGAAGEGAAGGEDWIATLTPEVRKQVLADREKLARMEGELSVLKKPEGGEGKPEAVANPLSAVATVEDLEVQEQRAEFWRDWAFQNRDGGTVKDESGNDVEITAEQAAAMFVHNDKVLRKHVPARRAELAAAAEISQGRTAAFEAATVEYPWLANQESDEFKLFQRLAGAMPEVLNRFSDSPWLLADMVAGHLARQAKGKPAAGSAAAVVPSSAPAKPAARPTVVPGGGNAGGSRGGSSNRAMSLEDLAKQGGSRDATVRWIEENFGVEGAA